MSSKDYNPPKIVFPHIQKTGGTSIIRWIARHYAYQQVLAEASTWKELFGLSAEILEGKRFVRGHFGSGIVNVFGERGGFRPIALIRNPIDRIVSHFWHLKRAPDAGKELAFMREESFTIHDFLQHPKTQRLVSDYQTANYSSSAAQAQRGVVTVPTNPEISPLNLDNAKAFIDRCDVVGVTENMDTFITALAVRLGFFADTDLIKARSYGSSEEPAVDIEDRVRELNKLDFELYEYAKRRANMPTKSISASPASNPSRAAPDGVIRWSAGEPFWGRGWSDFVRDKVRDHVWSAASNASIQFSVSAGERYMVVITVLRFVSQIQSKCFSVVCNGRDIAPTLVSKAGGGTPIVYAASLGKAETDELTIEFSVDRLVGFGEPLSTEPDIERRGLALCSVDLLPCE